MHLQTLAITINQSLIGHDRYYEAGFGAGTPQQEAVPKGQEFSRIENLWPRDGSCSQAFTLFAISFLESLSFFRYAASQNQRDLLDSIALHEYQLKKAHEQGLKRSEVPPFLGLKRSDRSNDMPA